MVMNIKDNIITKIIAVSIIFIVKYIYWTIILLNSLYIGTKQRLLYIFIILYHFGEERLLKAKKDALRFPFHLGVILERESLPFILKNLTKLIHWSLLTEIKHLTIYDPFGVITGINLELFKNAVQCVFNRNYKICLVIKDMAYNCKNKKEFEASHIINEKFDIIINLIEFKDANEDLISKVLKGNGIRTTPEYYYEEINDKMNIEKPETFYTVPLKAFPELILCFGLTEICLYGFPFTQIETSEIMKTSKLSSLNVLEFISIFEKYSKIDKRLGR